MKKIIYVLFLLSVLAAGSAPASERRLLIDWPDGWTVSNLVHKGKSMRLRSVFGKEGTEKAQVLTITAVDTRDAEKKLSATDLRPLIDSLLANLTPSLSEGVEVQKFDTQAGYYFVINNASTPSAKELQILEGVILNDQYLFNVSLINADMTSVESIAIRDALSRLSLE